MEYNLILKNNIWASLVAQLVKNMPANAGNARGVGSIPWTGRCPGGGHDNSTILAWRIPWIKEPGGLQSICHKESDRTEHKQQHYTIKYTNYV